MSLFILDTDCLTLHQHRHPILSPKIRAITAPDQLAITVISVEEQISGWYTILRRAKQPDEIVKAYQLLADCVEKLAGLPILSLSMPALMQFRQLVSLKLNVSNSDLRIAAITLVNSGTLITRNVRDFQRVPNLRIEDWTV